MNYDMLFLTIKIKDYFYTTSRLIVLFALCSGFEAQTLNLSEGDVCPKANDGPSNDYICKPFAKCITAQQQLAVLKFPRLCAEKNLMVCCPPDDEVEDTTVIKSYTATEMCQNYSELIYKKVPKPTLSISSIGKYDTISTCRDYKPLIVGGTKADPKEFPHMALIGFGNIPKYIIWNCGGSLISDRWILSAGHCEKFGSHYAQWVRLGDLDYKSNTDNARPKTYEITSRVLHPNYKAESSYNDLALFRLNASVEFSEYIRPLCLDVSQYLTPDQTTTATGWGQIRYAGAPSTHLLKVVLNVLPHIQCNTAFPPTPNTKYLSGISESGQFCAGSVDKDTCQGDSGGPLQIIHPKFSSMYIQIGITSFGDKCGNGVPGVYTKVSNYINWIETTVWPK